MIVLATDAIYALPKTLSGFVTVMLTNEASFDLAGLPRSVAAISGALSLIRDMPHALSVARLAVEAEAVRIEPTSAAQW